MVPVHLGSTAASAVPATSNVSVNPDGGRAATSDATSKAASDGTSLTTTCEAFALKFPMKRSSSIPGAPDTDMDRVKLVTSTTPLNPVTFITTTFSTGSTRSSPYQKVVFGYSVTFTATKFFVENQWLSSSAQSSVGSTTFTTVSVPLYALYGSQHPPFHIWFTAPASAHMSGSGDVHVS